MTIPLLRWLAVRPAHHPVGPFCFPHAFLHTHCAMHATPVLVVACSPNWSIVSRLPRPTSLNLVARGAIPSSHSVPAARTTKLASE